MNVLEVNDNKLLKTVYEENFDENKIMHSTCLDLDIRTTKEDSLYNILKKDHPNLRPDQVIIDIPEPISFEIDIPILFKNGELSSFKEIDDIFNKSIIKNFEKSLRKVRIFTINEITKKEMNEAIIKCMKK
jgi:hypothetical protein